MARSSLKNVARLIDVAQNNLPIEQSFLEDLKRSIELTNDKNSRKPSQTYKPSGMKCIRSMYYGVIGAEPDTGSSSYCLVGICNSGTDTHVRIQTAVADMKNNGIDCEYVNVADFVKARNLDYLDIVSQDGMETKLFHKTLNISFMCDGIIKYMNHYYILELKTESLHKWANRKAVNPEHYNQGIAYSMALGLDEVLFVYINRDNLDMKSYMFKVTDDMKQELVGRIELCDSYVSQLKVPPIEENFDRHNCTYCGYRTLCAEENDETNI